MAYDIGAKRGYGKRALILIGSVDREQTVGLIGLSKRINVTHVVSPHGGWNEQDGDRQLAGDGGRHRTPDRRAMLHGRACSKDHELGSGIDGMA